MSSRRVFALHLFSDVSFASLHFRLQFHQSKLASYWEFIENSNFKCKGYRVLPFAYQVAIFSEILIADDWTGNDSRDWEVEGFENHLMAPERWALPPRNSLKRMQMIYSDTYGFNPSVQENRAIRWAAIEGHVDTVSLLLCDIRVNSAACHSRALIDACELGHYKVAELLLLTNPNCDPGEFENSAIWKSAKAGHTEIVNLLLQDSRVDPTVFDQMPLKLAVQENHINIVRILLDDFRVDPAAQANWCIQNACELGRFEIAQLLLQHPNTDPRAANCNALQLAIHENHLQIVELLLQDGRSDPAVANNYCLRFSATDGNLSMVKMLIKDSRVSVSNRTIAAVINCGKSNCAQFLIEHKLSTSSPLQPPSKSLYQRCIDLLANLYSFPPLFEFFLSQNDLIPDLSHFHLHTIADPLNILWHTFKLGAPLCILYNELAFATTGKFLEPTSISAVTPGNYPKIPCKDNLYKFIAACTENNIPLAKEIGGISDLYKDNTHGFMKFLSLVEDIVNRIKFANNMPAPRKLPFTSTTPNVISSPLENRSRVLKEMIETERAYVFSMEQLKLYENELRTSRLFTKDTITLLVSNLDELLDFQRRFSVGMEVTVNLGVFEHRIGQLFILNEDAFAVYFRFCRNYQRASDFVRSQTEYLKIFGLIIDPSKIQSYLNKPVQRLMNYPIFLQRLINMSEPKIYPHMEELDEALQSIKRVISKLSEILKQDENALLKIDLAKKTKYMKKFNIDKFGDLLLTDEFSIVSNQNGNCILYLFEHVFICREKESSDGKRRTGTRSKYNKNSPFTDVNECWWVYVHSFVRIEDYSNAAIGLFQIRVFWRKADTEIVNCVLKGRDATQVTLWTHQLKKQVKVYRRTAGLAALGKYDQQTVGPALQALLNMDTMYTGPLINKKLLTGSNEQLGQSGAEYLYRT
ncbi:hypothetical protein HK100_000427 [Physocladia obscura]|uniref:DH domain-containing protein n=1 Tax=Physocladia obscura TaxID=109957 RepID=A0AAD5T159_9FUNG|nr:hypothetical protein HK100_000427 [Physocladia obscura]